MHRLVVALAVCAALSVPASAAGAPTPVGSDLTSDADGSVCGTLVGTRSCTLDNVALPASVSGVVVHWRIKTGATTAGFSARPRIISANTGVGGGGSAAPVPVPAAAGTYTFDTRLTIHAGEAVGVDVLGISGLAGVPVTHQVLGSAAVNLWDPPLGDGETKPPTMPSNQKELLVQADVEPDADGDGFGDESQDACPSDASTQGICPQPAPAPSSGNSPSGGSSSGSSSSGGASGTAGGGTLPSGVVSPGIVAAQPPLVAPKTAKKKRLSCKKRKGKRLPKACKKRKRKHKRG
jgi:hypothetical protein